MGALDEYTDEYIVDPRPGRFRRGDVPAVLMDGDTLVVRNRWGTIRVPCADIISIQLGDELMVEVETEDEIIVVEATRIGGPNGMTHEEADAAARAMGAAVARVNRGDTDDRTVGD